MATHSSILAWRIPWTEEPGRLQFGGSQGVGHDWSDLALHIQGFRRQRCTLKTQLNFPFFLISSSPLSFCGCQAQIERKRKQVGRAIPSFSWIASQREAKSGELVSANLPGPAKSSLRSAELERLHGSEMLLWQAQISNPGLHFLLLTIFSASHSFHSPLPKGLQNIAPRSYHYLIQTQYFQREVVTFLPCLIPFATSLILSGIPVFLQATRHKIKWSKNIGKCQPKLLNRDAKYI